jgi:hypothetical protein
MARIATLVISALTAIPGPNSACPVESAPLAYPWDVGRRGSAADLQQEGAPGAAGGARSLRNRGGLRHICAMGGRGGSRHICAMGGG